MLLVLSSTPNSVDARVMRIVDGKGGGVLYPGDVVITDSKSTALISFYVGGTVALKPNSQFTVDSPESVSLNIGHMWVKFEQLLNKRFQVRTPGAVLAVRGTEFTVQVNEGDVTTVAALSGEVEVQDPVSNVSVILTENQMMQMPKVAEGLSELEMQQKVEVFDPLSVARWWEEAKPVEARVSGGDIDLVPDLELNYTYVWPTDSYGLNVFGVSNYELAVTFDEQFFVDFIFTYVADDDTQIDVLVLNKMPIIDGWLYQFDFVSPPTSNIGSMMLINEGPYVGAGYILSQSLKGGKPLVITGRLFIINQTAVDLFEHDLVFKNRYSLSYMPITDIVVVDGQALFSSVDVWDAFGIPLPETTLDIVREMEQQENLFNQEKIVLQSELSDLEETLLSTQEQVNVLQNTFLSMKDSLDSAEMENIELAAQVSSLEDDKEVLQNEVSAKDSMIDSLQMEVSSNELSIDSLQSQLDQNQTIIYGSSGAAIVLLILVVVLALRKHK